MSKNAKIIDGAYTNMVTGLGQGEMDKAESTKAKGYGGTLLAEMARMKLLDGIAAGIVERPVESAFKGDLSIIGDDDGKILKGASEIGLLDAVREAGEYVRLFGGAVVVTEYENEVSADLKNIPSKSAKIARYWVYSAGKVELNSSDFDGEIPKFFRVKLLDGSSVEINPARCFVFKGVKIPDMLEGASLREAFFGVSALKSCEGELKDFASVCGSIVNMAMETGVSIFNLEGLNEMLSKPDSGINDVHQLMSIVKLSMNSMRSVFAGPNDKFTIMSHNFSGLPDVFQKMVNRISAVSRIPVSILFGQSATGLAQTNKGDSQAYSEMVENWRSRYMYRTTCAIIKDFSARNFGSDCSEFEWGEVCPLTLDEELEAKKKQMEIVEKAINLGIITPDEARNSLFVNGHSWNISVEGEA